MTSLALWIPLLWLLIVSSRPISFWFHGGILVESPDAYLEGSPLDASLYFVLMAAGIGVLFSRGLNWGKIFSSNRWLFVFILYCGVSVIWSDYPFVSFKRWIKDLGNVVMVLIVLSDKDSVEATRALLARFTYIVIPLSVLFIKYYSDYGKYFMHTGDVSYCGVATEKNALGCLAMVSGLFLLWDLIQERTVQNKRFPNIDLLSNSILLMMVFWLLSMASSSTALVCLVFGACVILILQLPIARRYTRYLGTYSLIAGLLILLLYSVPFISEAFVEMLGKDMTLTGRTILWTQLLSEPIDPILGTGNQSFWLGPRAQEYWERWTFHPNQAHNGYLETYLNGGLVGVFLLLMMIISSGRNLKKEVLLGSRYGIFCISLLFVSLIYNWSEAMFNKMSPIWFILLMTCLSSSRSLQSMPQNMADGVIGRHSRSLLKHEHRVSI
jgi:exopolysaccharide production protein ExoQ